jgi:predicted molibdopterin-dependent oxidoreductase YjgC
MAADDNETGYMADTLADIRGRRPGSTADERQLFSGVVIKIYNERGAFGAKAHVTDDVPPGVVWIAMDGSGSIISHLAMRF